MRGPTPDSEIDPTTWIGIRKTVSPKNQQREEEQPGIINIRTKKLVDRPCRQKAKKKRRSSSCNKSRKSSRSGSRPKSKSRSKSRP